jgi:hypothetical protein
MYTVVRQYSGQGAIQLFDLIESKKDEVERLIRGVTGLGSLSSNGAENRVNASSLLDRFSILLKKTTVVKFP